MSHNSTAKKVRLAKALHPDDYCANGLCLWNHRNGFCPKHEAPGRQRFQQAEVDRLTLDQMMVMFAAGSAHVMTDEGQRQFDQREVEQRWNILVAETKSDLMMVRARRKS